MTLKLLVFGSTGQVGRALSARAVESGVELEQHDRRTADLADPAACAALIAKTDAAAIINAAAWTAVDDAESAEDEALVINAAAPSAMAKTAAEKGLPFVHISTDYVFSGQDGPAWKPTDQPDPQNAYGRTKRAGEEAVMAANGTAVILRTAWVFDGTGKNFVTTMLRLGQTHQSLRVVADQYGGPTPAAAIADACIAIAKRLLQDPDKSGIYHISGKPDVTWAEFARTIFARSRQKVSIEDIPSSEYPTPATRPLNSRLDCSSLANHFGITPPDWSAALDQIIKETSQ